MLRRRVCVTFVLRCERFSLSVDSYKHDTQPLDLAHLFPSQCSVSCGPGRATRQVDCSNYHRPVDPSFCHPDEKPPTEQECSAGACPSSGHHDTNNQPYGYPQDPGRHPGHSRWNVPSADNQWRTGPWGAVC